MAETRLIETSNGACPNCGAPAVQTRRVEVIGEEIEITFRCDCQVDAWEAKKEADEEKDKQRRLDRTFRQSGLGKRFWDATLADICPRDGIGEMMSKAREFLTNKEDRIEDGRGLLLMGGVGTGKTHVASAICVEVMKANIPSVFLSMPEFIGRVKRTHRDDHAYEVWHSLRQAKLVVLDDIGIAPSFAESEIYEIVNRMYRQQTCVVGTTNLKFNQFKNDTGAAPFSRLLEMCEWAKVTADDYRPQIGEAS